MTNQQFIELLTAALNKEGVICGEEAVSRAFDSVCFYQGFVPLSEVMNSPRSIISDFADNFSYELDMSIHDHIDAYRVMDVVESLFARA